jgi:hypothetical protein
MRARSLITKSGFDPDRKKLVAGGVDPGAGLSAAGYNNQLFLKRESSRREQSSLPAFSVSAFPWAFCGQSGQTRSA